MNFPTTHRKIVCCLCALVLAGIPSLRCAPTQLVGNGSGTSSITGTVCLSNGKPAQGVLVSLFKTGDAPSPTLNKKSSYDSIFTDAGGRFFIKVNPDVFYNVIAENGGDKCLRDSIITLDTTDITDIGKLMLKPAGSLEGRVTLSAGHDPRTVLILAFGTNTFAVPNGSDGAFTLNNMAAGRYAVRFMSTIAGYRPLDTVLAIREGARDSLTFPISLSYTGLQKITDVHASWDSLLLSGVIRWRPVDTSQVHIKGYNVYRQSGHFPLTLKAPMITDTFYREDSLYVLPDSTFYFRVNAVLTTGEEGFPGLCTMDVSRRAWKKTASMRWPGFPPDYDYNVRFMEAGFGRIFMVNEQTVGILKVQDQLTAYPTIVHPPEAAKIKGIAVSNTGFYVATAACPSLIDSGSLEIHAYSRTGDSLEKKFGVMLSGQECGLQSGIKVLNDNDFYFLSNLQVDRRDATGELLGSFSPPRAVNPINTVYGALGDNLLHFFSTEYLTKWQLDVVSADCIVKTSVLLPAMKTDNFVSNRGHNTFFSIEKIETSDPYELRYFLSERNLNGAVISRIGVNAEKSLGAMFCCDEKGALYVRDAQPGLIERYER